MKRIIFVIFALLWISGTAFAGLEWKVKMVTQSEEKGANNTVLSQIYAQGGFYKQIFESVEKDNPLYQQGSYLLYNAKEDILYLANTKEKTYSEISLGSMFQIAGAFGKLVKIKISNPQVKMEKLGTEPVLDYTCNHYKMIMDYDTEVKVVLIKTKAHEHVEREVWSSPKVNAAEVVEGFRYRDFKTGMEDLDNLIDIQLKAEGQLGFPLKMVSVTTTTDKKGRTKETMRITQEVLSISTKTLPPSFFEIPADYQKQKVGLFNQGV